MHVRGQHKSCTLVASSLKAVWSLLRCRLRVRLDKTPVSLVERATSRNWDSLGRPPAYSLRKVIGNVKASVIDAAVLRIDEFDLVVCRVIIAVLHHDIEANRSLWQNCPPFPS